MSEMTTKDRLLLAQMPIVGMPPESPLERMERNGQRLVMAANGLFLEVRRDWLYAMRLCGNAHPTLQMPFGTLSEVTELRGGPIPRTLVSDFLAVARQACPMEVGGIITYDTTSTQWRLRVSHSLSASPVHLRYELPDLGPTEYRVVDIHSHGSDNAFLSPTDHHDMRGTTAVVMVAGKVDTATPRVLAFLCLQGMRIAVPWTHHSDIDIAVTESVKNDYDISERTLSQR